MLGAEPVPLRDLPDMAGIQREQIDDAVGYLERASLAEVVPTPGAKRGKSAALTSRSERAKAASTAKRRRLEATWEERHGETLRRGREALEPFPAPDLLAGLVHPPGTWRRGEAARPPPRFPLVTHGGGFPEGA